MIRFNYCPKIFLACILFGLTACGGGGDGGSSSSFQEPTISTTPVAITAQNDDTVADVSYELVDDLSEVSDGSGGGFSVPGLPNQTQNSIISLVSGLAKRALKADIQQGEQSTGVVIENGTQPCAVSGTATVSSTVTDSTPDIVTAGDSATLTYNNCDEGFGDTTNGSITITVNTVEPFDITITASNFKVTEADGTEFTLNGGFRISTSSISNTGGYTETVTGTSLYFVETGVESVHITNFSIEVTIEGSSYTNNSTFTVDSTEIGGRVTIAAVNVQGSIFDSYPSDGIITITGSSSILTMVILSNTSVQLDLDTDGNGTVDSSEVVTWDSLKSS